MRSILDTCTVVAVAVLLGGGLGLAGILTWKAAQPGRLEVAAIGHVKPPSYP